MSSFSAEQGTQKMVPLDMWLAVVFGVLFAVTAVAPDWLELFGLDHLDRGNGAAEGIVLVVLGVFAVVEGIRGIVALRRPLATSRSSRG